MKRFLFILALILFWPIHANAQGGGGVQAPCGGLTPCTNSAGSSITPPPMGLYVAPTCGTANTFQCYFTFADTIELNDLSWSNASNVITANTPEFNSGMCSGGPGCTGTGLSMSMMGWSTCADDQNSSNTGAGAISNSALVTVTGFIDSQHITISSNPSASASFTGSYPQGACGIIGHLDDSGFAAWIAGLAAAKTCPQGILPASYYFTQNVMIFTSPSCSNIGPGIGGNFGNTIFPAGIHIEGRCPGCTTIFIAPSFPNGNACLNKSSPSAGTGGCNAIQVMGQMSNLRFDGGSQAAMSQLNGLNFLSASVVHLENVTFTNLGAYNTGQMFCLETANNVIGNVVNMSGCGQVGILVPASTGNNVFWGLAVENNDQSVRVIGPNVNSIISPQFKCFYCNLLQINPTVSSANVNSRGGTMAFLGSAIRVFNSSVTNGLTGYVCNTTPGCVLDLVETTIEYNAGGGTNNNSAITQSVAGTVRAVNSTFQSQSAGTDYTDATGSIFYDIGGNSFSATPKITLSGSYLRGTQNFNVQKTGQVAAIADTTMVTVGSTTTAYNFVGSVDCTTTSAGSTATLNLKYTDASNTAQTISQTATCTTLGAGSQATISQNFFAKNATNVTYGVTIATTPTYNVSATLQPIGTTP